MAQLAPTMAAELVARMDSAERLMLAYLERKRSLRTREAYRRDLAEWAAWCGEAALDPLEVRPTHIDLWARYLGEELGRAPATVARKLSAVSGFYRWACEVEEVLDRNPARAVERPQVPQESPTLGLDREEARRLLEAADTPRDRLLVALLMLNGLRVSEACSAQVEDLGEERGHRVLTVTRKRGRREQIPLAPPTVEALEAYIDGRTDGPLLLDHQGAPMDRHDASRVVRRLTRKAGIGKHITPHSLRHTAVTLALDAGVPLRDVQDLAGHQDPRTTRRYDRARRSLDRHATYALAGWLA